MAALAAVRAAASLLMVSAMTAMTAPQALAAAAAAVRTATWELFFRSWMPRAETGATERLYRPGAAQITAVAALVAGERSSTARLMEP